MKANEAPEKIYLYPDDRAGYEYEAEWGDKPWGEDCVEYIRTDAFIEKAKKWFEQQNEWFDLNSNRHCDLDDFEDFIKYMKGE